MLVNKDSSAITKDVAEMILPLHALSTATICIPPTSVRPTFISTSLCTGLVPSIRRTSRPLDDHVINIMIDRSIMAFFHEILTNGNEVYLQSVNYNVYSVIDHIKKLKKT